MVTVNTVHDGCFHGQPQMDDGEWFREKKDKYDGAKHLLRAWFLGEK